MTTEVTKQRTQLENLHQASQALADMAIDAVESGIGTKVVTTEVGDALEAAGGPLKLATEEGEPTNTQFELLERLVAADILPAKIPENNKRNIILRMLAADMALSKRIGDDRDPFEKDNEYYHRRIIMLGVRSSLKSRARV